MPILIEEMDIKDIVERAPEQPGVYVFRDGVGRQLYVGKASSLRKRLGSYLKKSEGDSKRNLLLEKAVSLNYTVTDSEGEALLLEYNLIKEYAPKFNVRYRDDKRYPYLKLTNEAFPRVLITRSKESDGAQYFGPYPDGVHVRKVIRMLKQLFGLRTCNGDPLKQKQCLSLQIKRCVGPCTGKVSEREYSDLVEELSIFLKGGAKKLAERIEEKMKEYSMNLEFEKAAKLRDKLSQINALFEDKKIVSKDIVDRDFIGYAAEGSKAGVSVFTERGGRIVGHFFFLLDGEYKTDEAESVSSFIRLYYGSSEIPKEVVVGVELDGKELEEALSAYGKTNVKVRFVKRGRLKRLLNLVERNARVQLVQDLDMVKPLEALARLVGLKGRIFRIEGFDVSNISGKFAVGSMVVFEDGRAKKSDYRRFRIKTVFGVDDVAMISEVVSRRFRNDWPKPDLILVDGGAGQVNAARKVLGDSGCVIPVVGLAKEAEDLYIGGRRGFLSLPQDSAVIKLLVSVRDEAHRFAVTYHRTLKRSEIVSRRKS